MKLRDGRDAASLRVVVGMTGASGAIYALDFLRRFPGEKHVILSKWAKMVLHTECGVSEKDLEPLAKSILPDHDLSAPFASGSIRHDACLVIPASASTVGKIAAGIGDTLVTRAAQVALKERMPLILAVRETPLSTVTLEALHRVSLAGAIVFPLSPPFYSKPTTLEELVTGTTNKLLRLLGIEVPGGWHEEDLE
ncbi:MAG: UbiX family flavin prenyltransferase [Candidatus Eiseniibacteriota bacterium]